MQLDAQAARPGPNDRLASDALSVMNGTFYSAVLQHPPKSYSDAIFDDEAKIIWVDWREEAEIIVGYIRDKIGESKLTATVSDADNDWGYEVAVMLGDELRTITPELGFDAQHATLNAVDELVSPEFQIRFVSDTNGADTIGIVIESCGDWDALYQKYGRRLNEHFCPIREVPDLMNTPGDEIDQACRAYAQRIGQASVSQITTVFRHTT